MDSGIFQVSSATVANASDSFDFSSQKPLIMLNSMVHVYDEPSTITLHGGILHHCANMLPFGVILYTSDCLVVILGVLDKYCAVYMYFLPCSSRK